MTFEVHEVRNDTRNGSLRLNCAGKQYACGGCHEREIRTNFHLPPGNARLAPQTSQRFNQIVANDKPLDTCNRFAKITLQQLHMMVVLERCANWTALVVMGGTRFEGHRKCPSW
jgi:hypothetical protein